LNCLSYSLKPKSPACIRTILPNMRLISETRLLLEPPSSPMNVYWKCHDSLHCIYYCKFLTFQCHDHVICHNDTTHRSFYYRKYGSFKAANLFLISAYQLNYISDSCTGDRCNTSEAQTPRGTKIWLWPNVILYTAPSLFAIFDNGNTHSMQLATRAPTGHRLRILIVYNMFYSIWHTKTASYTNQTHRLSEKVNCQSGDDWNFIDERFHYHTQCARQLQ